MDARPSVPFRLISAATDNATLVVGTAARLTMLSCTNINAAVRYIKIYDLAVAPTVGTSTPVLTFAVPGAATGDGVVINLPVNGIRFSNGIGLGLVTGAADSVTTAVAAAELIVNGAYVAVP